MFFLEFQILFRISLHICIRKQNVEPNKKNDDYEKGIWTEVNCKYSAVPVAVVPDAIKKYVATNYPDAKMLKIERDKYDYEVKLSNGWEIKFDMQFNVIDIDN